MARSIMVVRAYRQRLASTVCTIRKTGDRSNSCCVHCSMRQIKDVAVDSEFFAEL
jgi:hypothetical protein